MALQDAELFAVEREVVGVDQIRGEICDSLSCGGAAIERLQPQIIYAGFAHWVD